MKKAFGQFLFLLYALVFVVCNTGYSNVGAYFLNQNAALPLQNSFNLIEELSECQVLIDAQLEEQKQLFAEISDVGEEEGDENAISSSQKFTFGSGVIPFCHTQLGEHLFFIYQRNLLSVKANCFISSFRRYMRFQVYRI